MNNEAADSFLRFRRKVRALQE